MNENSKFWHDSDVKPYKEGENPFYDEVLNDLVNDIIEQVHKNKLNAQENISEIE